MVSLVGAFSGMFFSGKTSMNSGSIRISGLGTFTGKPPLHVLLDGDRIDVSPVDPVSHTPSIPYQELVIPLPGVRFTLDRIPPVVTSHLVDKVLFLHCPPGQMERCLCYPIAVARFLHRCTPLWMRQTSSKPASFVHLADSSSQQVSHQMVKSSWQINPLSVIEGRPTISSSMGT